MKHIAIVCENFSTFREYIIREVEKVSRDEIDYFGFQNNYSYIKRDPKHKETVKSYYCIDNIEYANNHKWDDCIQLFYFGDNMAKIESIFKKVISNLK